MIGYARKRLARLCMERGSKALGESSGLTDWCAVRPDRPLARSRRTTESEHQNRYPCRTPFLIRCGPLGPAGAGCLVLTRRQVGSEQPGVRGRLVRPGSLDANTRGEGTHASWDCGTPAGQRKAVWPITVRRIRQLPRMKRCPGPESNQRHEDFQSSALPTELPGQSRARTYAVAAACRQGCSGSRRKARSWRPPPIVRLHFRSS